MAYYCENRSTDRSNVLAGGKAGTALAVGDLVYMDSSGNWQIAAAGAHNAEGIVESTQLIYQFFSPIKIGDFSGWSSKTIGSKAYLSTTGTTGNTITSTKPVGVQVQEIGFFSSATNLRVNICAVAEEGDEGQISVFGSDGKFKASYATIDLAVAALATGDQLAIKSGEYTLTGACDIAANQTDIIGMGEVNIIGAAGADYCFKIKLGAPAANGDVKFSNLNIVHDDDATMVGILIDNASTTRKIIVELEGVSFEGDGGDSIHVDHTVTTSEIKVYANGRGRVIEGPVNATFKHDGDKLRFTDYNLRGGVVTSADDKDAELLLERCKVLHEGVTGGHNNQRAYAMDCCTETDADPNVYAGFNTDDFAGSHTEVIWPAS